MMDLQKPRSRQKTAACRVAVARSWEFGPQTPKVTAGTTPSVPVNRSVSLSRFRVSWEMRNPEHL